MLLRWFGAARVLGVFALALHAVACKRSLAATAGPSGTSADPPRDDLASPPDEAPPREATPLVEPAQQADDGSRPHPSRVVLVTLDGVRWEDLFRGADPSLATDGDVGPFTDALSLAPNLARLAEGGVALGDDAPDCGVVRAHGTSNVSLPGYLEIFGGRATACRSNRCARVESPTVLDAAARAGSTVASIASWEGVARAASANPTALVVAAGANAWPAPLAPSRLADLVLAGSRARLAVATSVRYRPDAMTASIALEYLRAEVPRALHVGLGDADEWAHAGDYKSYLSAIHAADAFVGDLARELEVAGLANRTTVIVTADHGRARTFREHGAWAPESRRSFVIAFGGSVASPGARCASRDVELRDVGATVRRLLDLEDDESPLAGRPIEEIVGAAGGP